LNKNGCGIVTVSEKGESELTTDGREIRMYAVVETGGFQFSVKQGDRVKTPKLDLEPKQKLVLDRVLFIGGEKIKVGCPYVKDARIEAEVIDSGKNEKVMVFKKKRRTKYRRTRGHRQDFTEIRIEKIVAPR
jgi:large subunit ribosomal protein L21